MLLPGFAMSDRRPSTPSFIVLLLKVLLILCVLGMLAAGFSPLYQAFMRLTGLGGLPMHRPCRLASWYGCA